jgi:lipoic acid synthetase
VENKTKEKLQKLPHWFLKPIPQGKYLFEVEKLLYDLCLNSVCQDAKCPNLGECFSRRRATFMIMGNICTRNCRFCAIESGIPGSLMPDEPDRVAKAVKALELSHVVITSVTRDDLPDGGAEHFASTIFAIHKTVANAKVEVLVPDFGGFTEAIRVVLRAKPDIFSHNLETIPKFYSIVRPKANYNRSLGILRAVKEIDDTILTKSGMMLGLGESKEEILNVMKDLRQARCDFLTLGQYLPPSRDHLPLVRFMHTDEFIKLKIQGDQMGFRGIMAGPLVRSSYNADELIKIALRS